MDTTNEKKKYYKVSEIGKVYPFLAKHTVYRLIKHNTDGINKSVIKIGKSLYIERESLDKWVSERYIVRGA